MENKRRTIPVYGQSLGILYGENYTFKPFIIVTGKTIFFTRLVTPKMIFTLFKHQYTVGLADTFGQSAGNTWCSIDRCRG